jgi:hypothetical protein
MKTLGFFLTGAGFILGSYFLVLDRIEVNWAGFISAMAVGATGIVLLRLSAHKEKTHAGRLVEDVAVLEKSLNRIVENMNELESKKDSINVYDLGTWIDTKFPEDIERFINARESITYAYSLPDYATVMNPFAAGERHLNRVWSCSVDGYIDEAHTYITRSREQFLDAQERLAMLRKQKPA